MERIEKDLKKSRTADLEKERDLIAACAKALEAGTPLRALELTGDDVKRLRGFQFLTAKPLLIVVNVGESLKVYVDAYSAQYLDGAEIDYVDQLMGGGFTIHNPNAVRTCSCGHSFQTADGSGEARSCSH